MVLLLGIVILRWKVRGEIDACVGEHVLFFEGVAVFK